MLAYFALLALCALLGLLFWFALFACFDLLCLVDLRSSRGSSLRFHEPNMTWIGIKLLFLDFGKIQNFGSKLPLLYTFGMIFGKSPENGDFEIWLARPKFDQTFKPIRLVTSQKRYTV